MEYWLTNDSVLREKVMNVKEENKFGTIRSNLPEDSFFFHAHVSEGNPTF